MKTREAARAIIEDNLDTSTGESISTDTMSPEGWRFEIRIPTTFTRACDLAEYVTAGLTDHGLLRAKPVSITTHGEGGYILTLTVCSAEGRH
jgi:hypothetical protein